MNWGITYSFLGRKFKKPVHNKVYTFIVAKGHHEVYTNRQTAQKPILNRCVFGEVSEKKIWKRHIHYPKPH